MPYTYGNYQMLKLNQSEFNDELVDIIPRFQQQAMHALVRIVYYDTIFLRQIVAMVVDKIRICMRVLLVPVQGLSPKSVFLRNFIGSLLSHLEFYWFILLRPNQAI